MANFRCVLRGLARGRGAALTGTDTVSSSRPVLLSLINGNFKNPSAYKFVGARFFLTTGPASHIVVDMPVSFPTMNQGNIIKWLKKEGDKIDVGDIICEIETDKATLEFESLEEGYLAPEGSKDVLVGQPIVITVENPEEIKSVPYHISSGVEAKEEKSTETTEHKKKTLRKQQST